jgi:hypothetical protein
MPRLKDSFDVIPYGYGLDAGGNNLRCVLRTQSIALLSQTVWVSSMQTGAICVRTC